MLKEPQVGVQTGAVCLMYATLGAIPCKFEAKYGRTDPTPIAEDVED